MRNSSMSTPCPHHQQKHSHHHQQQQQPHHKNPHHDHGSHDGMAMNFHGGFKEIVLFTFWNVNSPRDMVLSCFGIVLMAILYEGLKVFREYLLQVEIAKTCSESRMNVENRCHSPNDHDANVQIISTNNNNNNEGQCACANGGGCCSRGNQTQCACPVGVVAIKPLGISRILTSNHFIQTALQVVQFTLSYLLMLIAMTYNTYLFSAVVLGSGIGYWLFGWRRSTIMDCSEHCH